MKAEKLAPAIEALEASGYTVSALPCKRSVGASRMPDFVFEKIARQWRGAEAQP